MNVVSIQALRRLMRVLEKEIEVNISSLEAEDDITLFHPPAHKMSEDFYPEEIGKIKEYRWAVIWALRCGCSIDVV
jgi:hypothetical protein